MPTGVRIIGAPVIQLVRNAYASTNVPLAVKELDTYTFASKASTGDGDYITVTDTNGLTWAVGLDTTGGAANTPTGAAWVAVPAARKVYYDISGTTTAATVATAAMAGLNTLSGFSSVITTSTNTADGICTAVRYGTSTAPAAYSKTGASGTGSVTAVRTATGVGYVTLVTSLGSATGYAGYGASRVYVYDSSGSTMALATGAAGAEVDQLYIPPGGLPMTYDVLFPYASRISIRAIDTAATANQLLLQFIGGPQ